MYVKTDLHVHSKYSEHPSEWFLQRIGANESYTEPEFIYQAAKAKGMVYVTLTDHNQIAGAQLLREKHPEDVFLSVESTAYFPEDNCKIHILVFGLNEDQFARIQEKRQNIYEFRDYLREQGLAHSVAHATYSENNKLTITHLEKLILLFDVFESLNGVRNRMHNQGWTQVLNKLTHAQVEELRHRHQIEPFSDTSWVKGFTGGSDDHAGLYIAKSYTVAKAEGIPEFLEQIKRKNTRAEGRHNDYKSFAFALYKIAYDFSKTKTTAHSSDFMNMIHSLVFDRKKAGLKNRFIINSLKWKKTKEDRVRGLLKELIEGLRLDVDSDAEKKLELVYAKLSEISDEFIKALLTSVERNLQAGNLSDLIMSLSASLPGMFLSLPFFNTLTHMYKDRPLIDQLTAQFGTLQDSQRKRILWFTDTLTDLNGVSSTLTSIGWLTHDSGIELKIVTALSQAENIRNMPPNTVELPCLHQFTPTEYKQYTLKVPSLLKSLEIIHDCDPDLIIISTPGPVGWMGLLAAKLLKVKHAGVYHSDFKTFALQWVRDESIANTVETFTRWFYSNMDEILVPSQAYLRILEERGYEKDKMRIFPRGLDSQKMSPKTNRLGYYRQKYWTQEGFNLLYVGRISKEKNLGFLAELYQELAKQHADLNLTLVGEGPYSDELKAMFNHEPRVRFAGSMPYEELSYVYSSADLMLFPSNCDTFGMAVLEAQACGLPAVVSDQGGPQEIIIEERTGWVAGADNLLDWGKQVEKVIQLKKQNPEAYLGIRRLCRQHVVSRYDWETAFQELFELKPTNTLLYKEMPAKNMKKAVMEPSLLLD